MTGLDVRPMVELACALCDDLAASIPSLKSSMERDSQYIRDRATNEGLSFLTKTLPSLGKRFDEELKDESRAPSFEVPYVAPRFLSGVRKLVQGRLDLPDRAWIYSWIRQLGYLFYKLEVPYAPETVKRALDAFVETDASLEESDKRIDPFALDRPAALLGAALSGFSPVGMAPRHGPGAVATGEIGDAKWEFRRKYRTVHAVFPMYDWFVPTLSCWRQSGDAYLAWYRSLECLDSPTARVVAVPKDSRGPRLISEEPLELQYVQQGFARQLVPFVERASAFRGEVNFTDQTINQTLAYEASVSREWATIDLKDASDRVSELLVWSLFPSRLHRYLRALRSRDTILPDGRRVHLNKFAPMGSAICFPVEALVFWCIAKAALQVTGNDDRVFVYGDDIVVPVSGCSAVCRALEDVGLKVNASKTYDSGFFRESCGLDAWDGYIVTPARVRSLPPSHKLDVSGLSNWVSVSNTLRSKGLVLSADNIVQYVSRFARLPWNVQSDLAWLDPWKTLAEGPYKGFKTRVSPTAHRLEVLAPVVRSRAKRTSLDGWKRLHRNLLMPPLNPDTVAVRTVPAVRWAWTTTL